MTENETTDNAALAFAQKLEAAVANPEEAARRTAKKLRVPGLFRIIFDCVKSYQQKDPSLSDEEWMKRQFARPEYATGHDGKAAWGEDAAKEMAEAAGGIARGVEDYENAKKSLRVHIEQGGSRESWLAQQIEIGAEANGVKPEAYAREIEAGMEEAAKENAALFDRSEEEEQK
jgi:hypothetical protein